mgnify:CR=1 FL=1
MELIANWHIAVYLASGLLGGLARAMVTGKGIIALPALQKVEGGSVHLNLGVLAPMFLGAIAGLVAPWALGINGIVSVLSGYSGSDFLENLVERVVTKKSS